MRIYGIYTRNTFSYDFFGLWFLYLSGDHELLSGQQDILGYS